VTSPHRKFFVEKPSKTMPKMGRGCILRPYQTAYSLVLFNFRHGPPLYRCNLSHSSCDEKGAVSSHNLCPNAACTFTPGNFSSSVIRVGVQARSQDCEKRPLAASCLSVCPSVRMKQFGSHWTDFREILYFSIFRKSVEKIRV